MGSDAWRSDEGWPYPDEGLEPVEPDGGVDDEALVLSTTPLRLDLLDPLEATVIAAHYGIGGTPPRSMKELHHELDIPRADLRAALAGGLAKLRSTLNGWA
jgi:DNA-directed RNA polymerase sigma subunit (sigma70/sigma32)